MRSPPMTRSARAKLAAETVTILDAGKYLLEDGSTVDLAASIRECVFETVLYEPRGMSELLQAVTLLPPGAEETRITVWNETSLQGAHALRAEGAGKIGVLNFASAKNPGGGFLGGSQAQEESLACRSALYSSLTTEPDYYDHHRSAGDPLYSHRAIYSPGCPVFRDDEGTLLREPLMVDFITCPAPNAGAVKRNAPASVPLIPETLRQRAACVLALACHHGCEALVLGAWGCGVFRNDPKMVAGLFKELLQAPPFSGRFKAVRFSVLDGTAEGKVIAAFQAALS